MQVTEHEAASSALGDGGSRKEKVQRGGGR